MGQKCWGPNVFERQDTSLADSKVKETYQNKPISMSVTFILEKMKTYFKGWKTIL